MREDIPVSDRKARHQSHVISAVGREYQGIPFLESDPQ